MLLKNGAKSLEVLKKMDKPCEFCGSSTRMTEGDFYKYPDAEEKVKTPCCNAQKRNMEYIRKRGLTEEEAGEVSDW